MNIAQLFMENLRTAVSIVVIPILDFLPRALSALIIVIVGLILASGLASLVKKILEFLQLDMFLGKLGLSDISKQFNVQISATQFLSKVVEWVVIVIMLLAVFDVLGLSSVNFLLSRVVLFLPNVLVAAVILASSAIAARMAATFISGLLGGAGVGGHVLASFVTKISIFSFGSLLALEQLGVVSDYVRMLFAGFVAMMAIAGGLAFGLGGKDFAASLLAELRQEVKK